MHAVQPINLPTADCRDLAPAALSCLIRSLRAGDEARLARFYTALDEATRSFFQPYERWDEASLREVVARGLRSEDYHLLALDAAGEVGAHLFINAPASELAYLGIGLRENWRGRGLGRNLLSLLLAQARHALGMRRIGLTVVKRNERALELYRGMGFQIFKEVTFRQKDDSYEMQLELTGGRPCGR